MGKKRSTKPKLHLVFDEDKRREFLTGFRKRKLQRKKHAKDEFEKALKEERKRIKAESKEEYKKLVASNRDIPELENLLEEEYEDDEATIKIVCLSTNDIARQNNCIGENYPQYTSDHEVEEEKQETHNEEIPGMELCDKTVKKDIQKKETFDTEIDLKKKLKKIATKRVQKSKVFQMKNKLEKQKQKKKSSQQKKYKEKLENKHRGGKKKR